MPSRRPRRSAVRIARRARIASGLGREFDVVLSTAAPKPADLHFHRAWARFRRSWSVSMRHRRGSPGDAGAQHACRWRGLLAFDVPSSKIPADGAARSAKAPRHGVHGASARADVPWSWELGGSVQLSRPQLPAQHERVDEVRDRLRTRPRQGCPSVGALRSSKLRVVAHDVLQKLGVAHRVSRALGGELLGQGAQVLIARARRARDADEVRSDTKSRRPWVDRAKHDPEMDADNAARRRTPCIDDARHSSATTSGSVRKRRNTSKSTAAAASHPPPRLSPWVAGQQLVPR